MTMAIRIISKVVPSAAMLFLMLLLLLQIETIRSRVSNSIPTTYIVGDEDGWDLIYSMESWPQGKNFHAGDILDFKYDDQFDVAVVNQKGHDTCTVNEGAKVYSSGHDKLQLVFGANYFIDTVPDLCAAGMKMAINATAPPPSF